MIDAHCHLLPGVDDGPQTMAEALALARACVENGITHAISTPHVYPGRWDNSAASLQPVLQALQQALATENIPLQIKLGAEVRVSEHLPAQLASGRLPFIGQARGNRILLLEMPDSHIPAAMPDVVRFLLSQRVRPLIAHPERNKAVMNDPEQARKLVQAGCWLQVTAASLLGQFGPRVKTAIDYLIEHDLVYLIATDCHNLHGRPPRLAEASAIMARAHGEAYARLLVHDRPKQIFASPGIGMSARTPESQHG